jgi:hypothetical protein
MTIFEELGATPWLERSARARETTSFAHTTRPGLTPAQPAHRHP